MRSLDLVNHQITILRVYHEIVAVKLTVEVSLLTDEMSIVSIYDNKTHCLL